MNFPSFMARRYLFSKKSHNLINIISAISMLGLGIGTAALIIVLSVFNGFEGVIKSLYRSINPDLLITAREGKTFHYQEFPVDKLKKFHEISYLVPVVEEDALFKYGDKQYIGKIKGYGHDFMKVSKLDSLMQTGSFVLESGNINYAVVGAGVAWSLGLNPGDRSDPLGIFVPRRGASSMLSFQNAFNETDVPVAGVFSVQQDFDQKYVLIPLRLARQLMNYKDEVTSVEVYVKNHNPSEELKQKVEQIVGKNFSVKNRFQQNETLYKIMKSEKMAVFLILVFILILASFNMIGSISLLIVEKVKDIAVLKSMGADKKSVRQIFLRQGILISLISAIFGLMTGFVVLWLQQRYGFVKLGDGTGDYIINAYPVKMELLDFIYVFFTVQIIGFLASWYPVRILLKDFKGYKLQ
ncbi:MAG: ABC transporter permease [Bacteroidales bacterium]|nr:ABC transporter permease [Bacteroidales bacterium]